MEERHCLAIPDPIRRRPDGLSHLNYGSERQQGHPYTESIGAGPDHSSDVVIISKTELELRNSNGNFICPYSVKDGVLRYVGNILGTQQAVYLKITDEGLQQGDWKTDRKFYLDPPTYDRGLRWRWSLFESNRTYESLIALSTGCVAEMIEMDEVPHRCRSLSRASILRTKITGLRFSSASYSRSRRLPSGGIEIYVTFQIEG